jgi:putative membrane protein
MAGLLYLPRIFVYHSENIKDKNISSVFKIMEKKPYYYIMIPAMLLSWFFGLILISIIGFESLGTNWLQLKLFFVILLTMYQFYLGGVLNNFRLDINKKSSRYFRVINEIPTILLVLIVFIIIFKPI